jgi:hypothetical protein
MVNTFLTFYAVSSFVESINGNSKHFRDLANFLRHGNYSTDDVSLILDALKTHLSSNIDTIYEIILILLDQKTNIKIVPITCSWILDIISNENIDKVDRIHLIPLIHHVFLTRTSDKLVRAVLSNIVTVAQKLADVEVICKLYSTLLSEEEHFYIKLESYYEDLVKIILSKDASCFSKRTIIELQSKQGYYDSSRTFFAFKLVRICVPRDFLSNNT